MAQTQTHEYTQTERDIRCPGNVLNCQNRKQPCWNNDVGHTHISYVNADTDGENHRALGKKEKKYSLQKVPKGQEVVLP